MELREERSGGRAANAAPAAAKAPAPAGYQSVLIRDVPFVRQKPDFCGEACAAAFLQKLGYAVDQNWVFNQSGLDPLLARGCYTKELAAALTASASASGRCGTSGRDSGEGTRRRWEGCEG